MFYNNRSCSIRKEEAMYWKNLVDRKFPQWFIAQPQCSTNVCSWWSEVNRCKTEVLWLKNTCPNWKKKKKKRVKLVSGRAIQKQKQRPVIKTNICCKRQQKLMRERKKIWRGVPQCNIPGYWKDNIQFLCRRCPSHFKQGYSEWLVILLV